VEHVVINSKKRQNAYLPLHIPMRVSEMDILQLGWIGYRCLHGLRQLVSLRCWVKVPQRAQPSSLVGITVWVAL